MIESIIAFQIFRIKVEQSRQQRLFEDATPASLLEATIQSNLTTELGRGRVWLIGDVERIDHSGLYFRFGRVRRSRRGAYKNGHFFEQETQEWPFTHVLVDTEIELCAIGRESDLAPYPTDIASRLGKVLSKSLLLQGKRITVEIVPISDPREFMIQLRSAARVARFWFMYSRPNPFDADEDFHKPFQRLVQETDADVGKTHLRSQSLHVEPLVAITQSVAKTGDDAEAYVYGTESRKGKRIRLRGSAVTAEATDSDLAATEGRVSLLGRIREIFKKISDRQGT